MKVAVPHLAGRTILRISWVPNGGLVPPDALNDFDLRRFHESALRVLQRALPAGAVMLGGIDVSLNCENNVPVGWQMHVYGLVGLAPEAAPLAAKRELRQLPVADCPRPLKLEIVGDPDPSQLISYALKAEFYLRSRYQYERRSTGSLAWNARAQRLGAAAALRVALMLERFPLGQRLLLVGLRRVGRPDKFDLQAKARLSSPSRRPGGEDDVGG